MIRRPPRSPLFPYPPLSRSLLRATKNVPLQPVTWSVITWAFLKGSTRRRCEERHVPIARFAPAAGRHRDDSDRDVLRSEEHTSELQSQSNLVCRLLLEKKKK